MAVDAEWIKDLFAAFGPVAVKRMFSGAGIFADGLMIGLVFGDVIYLRADEATRAAFVAEGSEPFRFDKPSQGKTISTGYFSLPARLYDDADDLAQWARAALAAARSKKAASGKSRGTQKSAKKIAAKKTARSPRKRAVSKG